jgi:hypothetical protein
MPNFHEHIATSTLSSPSLTLTFTSISQNYTDLEISIVAKAASSPGQHLYVTVGNGSYDTGNNYSNQSLYARGAPAGAVSGDWTSTFAATYYLPFTSYISSTSNKFSTVKFWIFNYSATDTKKPLMYFSNTVSGNTSEYPSIEGGNGIWNSLSAINQIKFTHSNPSINFDTGTSISIYGIKKA